jgi:hypothetical protein
MFRVSQQGDGIDDADTIEGAREIVRSQPSGRYDLDEIRALPALPGTYRIATTSPSRYPRPVELNGRAGPGLPIRRAAA